MTDIRTLETIAAELDQARQDVALLQRLKGAEDRVKRLTADHEKATAAHDKAEAAKVKATREARFAGLRDLCITEIVDQKAPGVLQNIYRIAYTRDAWNPDANVTVPAPTSITGFEALPPNVFAWIVERHPNKIPASIMALAPNDLNAALDHYFVGRRRGFLSA